MNDLHTFYSKYVTFSGNGNHPNLMAFCPIHGEIPGKSKPSLCINIETGAWICFAGCGSGGTAHFLKEVESDKAKLRRGLKAIKAITPTRVKPKKKKKINTFLPEALLGLFDFCPLSLVKDGFSEEVLQEHDVGFDRKTHRITYPIRNIKEDLIAIIGRRTNTNRGKYLPYTADELTRYGVHNAPSFQKGFHLYREDKVYDKIYSQSYRNSPDPIYIVEGFKAALWLVQHGYENTMALMGTHLTDEQASLLRKLGRPVIFCLDNDDAGLKGTVKNGYKIKDTLKVLACKYPLHIKQPDDIKDVEELTKLLEKPITMRKFNYEYKRRK